MALTPSCSRTLAAPLRGSRGGWEGQARCSETRPFWHKESPERGISTWRGFSQRFSQQRTLRVKLSAERNPKCSAQRERKV